MTSQRDSFSAVSRSGWLVSCALAGMTFTELEVAGVNPAVVLLAPALIYRSRLRGSGYSRPAFQSFLSASVILLALGAAHSLVLGVRVDGRLHGALSFGLAAMTVWVSGLFAPPQLEIVALRACKMVVAVQATLAMLAMAGQTAVAGVPLLFGGSRFKGLAENPNQLAIVLLIAVPVLCYGRRRLVWASMAVVPGLLSLSAGLAVSWATGAALGALAVFRATTELAKLRLLGALLVGLAVMPLLVGNPVRIAFEYAASIVGQGEDEDGNGRLPLNRHGVEAVLASPMVGLGPGMHSGVTGPHEGGQAHSLPVDWLTQTGVIGALVLVRFLWRAVWRRCTTDPRSAFAAGAFTAYAFSGYALRHPIVWVLLLVLYDGRSRAGLPNRSRRAPLIAAASGG